MSFEEVHSMMLADSSLPWRRFIQRLPLLMLRTYYEAGRSHRHERGDKKLLRVRKSNIVRMPHSERLVHPFPPVVKPKEEPIANSQ